MKKRVDKLKKVSYNRLKLNIWDISLVVKHGAFNLLTKVRFSDAPLICSLQISSLGYWTQLIRNGKKMLNLKQVRKGRSTDYEKIN